MVILFIILFVDVIILQYKPGEETGLRYIIIYYVIRADIYILII